MFASPRFKHYLHWLLHTEIQRTQIDNDDESGHVVNTREDIRFNEFETISNKQMPATRQIPPLTHINTTDVRWWTFSNEMNHCPRWNLLFVAVYSVCVCEIWTSQQSLAVWCMFGETHTIAGNLNVWFRVEAWFKEICICVCVVCLCLIQVTFSHTANE